MTSIRFTLLFSFLCLSIGSGCGGPEGPEKFALTGTVTREGKPIELGAIQMAPTGGGPAAQVNIEEGKYEFTEETGPVKGDHVVTILSLLKRGPIPPGGVAKDADFIPETGFESRMPEGGWVLKTTVSPDQDVSQPVDFNVDNAEAQESRGAPRQKR